MNQVHSPSLNIITGCSRGLGEAMALQLLQRGDTVLGISRGQSAVLSEAAAPAQLTQWSLDLSEPRGAADALQRWLLEQPQQSWSELRLVNNAGVIPEIGPLATLQTESISAGLRVGLEAAMVLSAVFLEVTQHWQTPRKVLNISSGLGRRAMASQAVYCAAKAGMDHFTRCVALEEASKLNGAKLCALAPGVIATEMQVQLRNAPVERFPDRQRFQQLQHNNQLQTPMEAAKRILERLDRADFGNEAVADIRD